MPQSCGCRSVAIVPPALVTLLNRARLHSAATTASAQATNSGVGPSPAPPASRMPTVTAASVCPSRREVESRPPAAAARSRGAWPISRRELGAKNRPKPTAVRLRRQAMRELARLLGHEGEQQQAGDGDGHAGDAELGRGDAVAHPPGERGDHQHGQRERQQQHARPAAARSPSPPRAGTAATASASPRRRSTAPRRAPRGRAPASPAGRPAPPARCAPARAAPAAPARRTPGQRQRGADRERSRASPAAARRSAAASSARSTAPLTHSGGCGLRTGSGSARPSSSETNASGTAATNTHCHGAWPTMNPPSVGASAEDEATITLLIPIPLPSCLAG